MTEESSSNQAAENEERKICANGACIETATVEDKLDAGDFDEAESALREGLSLNSEEAQALLGRLEYQRGNVQAALRVFEDIDLQAAIQKLQPFTSEKSSKKGRSRSESVPTVPQQTANLLLEAVYLKAKSLQKLDRINEAAEECSSILDAVDKMFLQGMSDSAVDGKLQETVSRAAELLPQLWEQTGSYSEAIACYRRALLGQWNLTNETHSRIQKNFAVLLLYGGADAGAPALPNPAEGAYVYVPKNNLEESILLLTILLRKFHLGKTAWDPSVIEHLAFALTVCSQTPALAKQLEEILPGVFRRVERWKLLALCFGGSGETETALELLRKSLHKHESPDDVLSLLLAAKFSGEGGGCAAEGIGYARRAIENCHGRNAHLKGVGLRVLGLCLGKEAIHSASDFERSRLQSEALKSLEGAAASEPENPDLLLELGVHHAVHRNLTAALRLAKQYVDATGGSVLRGWRFLAMVLSAQQRFAEAEVVTDAALDETVKWDQGPLLRMKAKLKVSQSRHLDAIETYRQLLALVQAQKNSCGPVQSTQQVEDDRVNEYEVWQGLANLYSSLSRWKDAEICLSKARAIIECSPESLHTEGAILQRQGKLDEALATYVNALLVEPNYVPSKISVGAILSKRGPRMLPVARTLLSDALRLEPTNRLAWLYLGLVHKDDGRLSDAIDCFQAASMLEESDPIESFGTIL